uniref:protein farnesyltransferase subunit beta-like isoform X8 n=1 Tax=Myxine glutinosa TaxID=7769 RepID=UPI00358FF226
MRTHDVINQHGPVRPWPGSHRCGCNVLPASQLRAAIAQNRLHWDHLGRRCQNWEGGLDGVPGMEAHGGYTFCGLAAMILFGKARMLDLSRLLRWAVNRQMRFEGGFQGRTNKLVDGCYSFWQAGLLPLLHRSLHAEGDSALSSSSWMFHVEALQESACLLPMSSRRDA